MPAFSIDDLKIEDQKLVKFNGVVPFFHSPTIDTTEQYYGLPKVPLVHSYNDFFSPQVFAAVKGHFPKNLYINNQVVREPQ